MITVVIPTANNPFDLAVLYQQLQQQTVLPNQIFIADNSEDGYVQPLVERYQWNVATYIHRKAGSIYKSWNTGITFAETDHVVVLNDDLLIPEDFIRRFKQGFEDGHHCLCPSSPGFPPVNKVRESYRWKREGTLQSYQTRTDLIHSHLPLLTGWCYGLSRELITTVGLFDEDFQIWYGDTDYSKRLAAAGYKHTFIPELFVHHYGTSSYSKINKKVFSKTNYEDQVKYEKKHSLPHTDLGWDAYA